MKALIVGDVCLDKYVYGSVYGTAPEAPIPVLKVEREETKEGMAANVRNELKTLISNVDIITINNPATIKQRFVAGNTIIARADYEVVGRPECYEELINHYEEVVYYYDFVILSDYGKSVLHTPEYFMLHHRTYVDPDKNKHIRRYEGAFCIKANEKEALTITGCNNVQDALQEMSQWCSLPVVTLGAKGSVALYRGIQYECPAIETMVVDVTGCGDSFLAAFSYWMERTNNVAIALKQGNIKASQTVGRFGV